MSRMTPPQSWVQLGAPSAGPATRKAALLFVEPAVLSVFNRLLIAQTAKAFRYCSKGMIYSTRLTRSLGFPLSMVRPGTWPEDVDLAGRYLCFLLLAGHYLLHQTVHLRASSILSPPNRVLTGWPRQVLSAVLHPAYLVLSQRCAGKY